MLYMVLKVQPSLLRLYTEPDNVLVAGSIGTFCME